ncbi:MAG: hypothetical protein Ta2G_02020 [Termitinemataceae bacterium]|nr:MAG: hypothetical protein Ta2G_02020 [Termitinemataceae bacterium]
MRKTAPIISGRCLTLVSARIKSHIARFKRITETARQTATIEKKEAAEKEIIVSNITAGNIVINPSTRRVFVSETEIELANKEYELLFFLASNPEIVFSKEKLYDKIWGEDMYGDINTVREHITRLRKKIERDPSNPVHIQTVWGAGYRLCG